MTEPHPRPFASPWAGLTIAQLLAEHGLAGVEEQPFPNDGWSGARLTLLERGGERFVLKRTSWAIDWIARSTRDHALREAVLASAPGWFEPPLMSAHVGASADGTAAAILMPDLGRWLIPWDRGDGGGAAIDDGMLDQALEAMAAIHTGTWAPAGAAGLDWPWCPIRERLQLLSRPAAERYRAGGLWVGERFLHGWDAFERLAPPAARALVAGLSADPGPLVEALDRLPATGLHGDLKLANLALFPDGIAAAIDWQMVAHGPVALELGWFLVANVAQLPGEPDAILERYRRVLVAAGGAALVGDWDAQRDLAILVGILLRGWRKGLDAEAGGRLPTRRAATTDLAWWSIEATAAAGRRL
ncbi:MAG: phosphotransferase [Chloroflexi bacterium]|nr:phosphotransferase [Chloroflexota bacterium]